MKYIILAALLAISCTAWLGCERKRSRQVTWINDSIREKSQAWQKQERDGLSIAINPYPLTRFMVEGRSVELGLRDDGSVVWRPAP